MGYATKATAEKGREIRKVMTAHLVTLVENLKNMPLEEIQHKKY